jgi:hypothetical protein
MLQVIVLVNKTEDWGMSKLFDKKMTSWLVEASLFSNRRQTDFNFQFWSLKIRETQISIR